MTLRMKDEFSSVELKNKEDPHCKECLKRLKEQGKTRRCIQCRNWYGKEDVDNYGILARNCHLRRLVCNECEKTRKTWECVRCEKEKAESDSPASQRKKELQKRICSDCLDVKQCSQCKKQKDPTSFFKEQRRMAEGVCRTCDKRRCGRCSKEKGYEAFEPSVWELANGSPEYCCRECTRGRRTRGMWACMNKRCKLQKPHEEFSLVVAKHGEGVKGNSRVCNSCVERREKEESEMCRKSSEQVQKRQRHEYCFESAPGQKPTSSVIDPCSGGFTKILLWPFRR